MNKIRLAFTADIITFSKGKEFSDNHFQNICNRLSKEIKESAKYNEFLADNINLQLEWKK